MNLRSIIAADTAYIFNDSNGFAVDVTHVNGAVDETLRAIADIEKIDGFENVVISGNQTALALLESAAVNVDSESTITYNSTVYNVRDIHPPKNNVLVIELTEA